MVNDPLLFRQSDSSAERADTMGEQSALFDTRRLGLLRFAFLLTGSRSVAEELVQDAFEQVVRRWDEIERPAGYLRVAVINGARSWGRRGPVPMDHPADPVVIDEDAVAVRDALADLPYPHREAIVLRYYVGLTDTEIADELDQPLGSIKSNIRRGLSRMKEEFS